MLQSSRRKLTRQRLLRLLEEIEAAPGPAASLYLPPGSPRPDVEKTLAAALKPEEPPPGLAEAIARSTTGAALFWGEPHRCLVLPPFPIIYSRVFTGYDVEPLRALLKQELTLALVLVRLGAYALGVFHGERLLSSKVGTGNVHARHRQGGSSAHRFERHREKQMEYFFERLCGHAREHIEPYLQQIAYVLYGGERFTVAALQKQCPFLQRLEGRTLERLLNVREPKQAALESAIADAWSSGVVEWGEG